MDEYHAIPLDRESQKLTSFITDWGRYMNFWMPHGFKAAEDIYTKRYHNIINTISNKKKIVDDTLLYNYNIEESFFATWDFLTLMANNGIVASANKFQFCQETVEFAGLIVTSTGVAPSHKTLAAIQNFPTLTYITGACSWFGHVNQVSWAYATNPIMQPFEDLIKPHVKFYQDKKLDAIFHKSKQQIIQSVMEDVQSLAFNCKLVCKQTGVKMVLDIYYYSNMALAHQPTFPPVVLLDDIATIQNVYSWLHYHCVSRSQTPVRNIQQQRA